MRVATILHLIRLLETPCLDICLNQYLQPYFSNTCTLIFMMVLHLISYQVFVCCNNATSGGLVHGALVRNLIQMFDNCVNKYDFNDVRHLACSEVTPLPNWRSVQYIFKYEIKVRKANLANCQFMTSLGRKDGTFGVSEQHRNCVRSVAVEALVKTKFVKEEVFLRLFGKISTDV